MERQRVSQRGEIGGTSSHMHATGPGTAARMEHTADAWAYKTDTSWEARLAVLLGHNLLLQNLRTQNDYFDLYLFDVLNPHFAKFDVVWDKVHSSKVEGDNVAERVSEWPNSHAKRIRSGRAKATIFSIVRFLRLMKKRARHTISFMR